MIQIYYLISGESLRKIIIFLKKNKIDFKLISLKKCNENIMKKILYYSDNLESIISKNSKVIKKNQELLTDQTKINQLILLMTKYPSIIKNPVLIEPNKNIFLTGYNPDDIEIFLR